MINKGEMMQEQLEEMEYEKWFDLYKPIKNHLDNCASADGYLFMHYGKEWDFVEQFNHKNIWSLIITDREDDTSSWEILNGVRIMNREGYFVTTEPYDRKGLMIIR